uniref:CUB domain-containing protein n=1 Tax=Knipowitschia caucasica TaxID=637954 RepID=A0AAV2MCZ1_KNICA
MYLLQSLPSSGVQDSQLEKVLTISAEGTLISPNFPHTYPRNTALVWRLVVPNNMRIQVHFDQRFGLEEPEDGVCKYDFVELEDLTERSVVGRWCGAEPLSNSYVSKGSQLRVRFISDEYFPSAPGFCIRYALQPMPQVKELPGETGALSPANETQ